MVTVTWSLTADFDRSGSYETDLTPYIEGPGAPVRVSRGIGRDGKPRTSKLTLTLKNTDGTFTPENSSSSLYGLLNPGVPVRLTATHNSIGYTVATAYAMRWKCQFPLAGLSTCQLDCEDLFWFLQNGDPVNVTVAARTTDAALGAICDALGLTAGDRNFDAGVQSLPVHFCVGENPLEAMQAVTASEMGGLLYPGADGRIRFESRVARLGTAYDDAWGDGVPVGPAGEGYDLNPLEYVTNVTARATVFRTGQADTRVFEFSQNMFTKPTATSMSLAAGEIWERTFQANSATIALTAPAAITDYLANTAINGTGVDKTSALSVTVTELGGGRFRLKLRNTDAGTIFVTKFQLRGQPVEFFADRAEAQFTLANAGLKAGLSLQFDVPFAGDTGGKLRDYAYQELRVGRYPFPVITLPFRALIDADIASMLTLDLGDLIRYKSPPVDVFQNARVNDLWYVEGLEYSIPADWGGEWFDLSVTLIPSYVYRNLDAIAFDTFERADAAGGLGTSFSQDVWGSSTGFDIVSNVARANTDTLSIPDLLVGANDQVVEVQLAAIGAGDEVGVVLRKQDASNYARVYLKQATNEVVLELVVAGVVTELSSPAFTVGSSHEIRTMVQGFRWRVWVDGKLYIDVENSTLTWGLNAGLMARNASGTATFDNFYAQGLSVTAPAPPSGLDSGARFTTQPLPRTREPLLRRRRRTVTAA